MRHIKVRASLAAWLLFGLVAACSEEPLTPEVEIGSGLAVPSVTLVADSTLERGTLLDSFTIELPVRSQSSSGNTSFDLWLNDQASGPVLVEVVSRVHHEGRTIPVTEFLTSGELGTVLYYHSNGDLYYRHLTVAFCALPSCSADVTLENLQEVVHDDPADSIMFRDTDAAQHGLRLLWAFSQELDHFYNALSGDPPPECAVSGGGDLCWPPPPFDSAHISDSILSGSIQVRAYLAHEIDDGPVTVRIDSTTTTGEGNSFLTLVPENQVTHTGSVTPSTLTPSLAWSVEVMTPRGDLIAAPTATASGSSFDWTVPPQSEQRYVGYSHAEAIAARDSSAPLPNALRFGIMLKATDSTGQEHLSDPVIVAQDEIDAMRHEYADYHRSRVPARSSFTAAGTTHFSPVELNFGDYSVFLATTKLRTGLEAVRASLAQDLGTDTPLTLVSGYRHPVHHHLHVGAVAPESQHQYGTAVDIRIWDHDMPREAFFELLRLSAQATDSGVCWEPEMDIRAAGDGTLTHAHLDWRGSCPDTWR